MVEHCYKLISLCGAIRECMNYFWGRLSDRHGRSGGTTDVSVGYGTIQLWQRDVVLVLITLEDNVSVSWNIELYYASGN